MKDDMLTIALSLVVTHRRCAADLPHLALIFVLVRQQNTKKHAMALAARYIAASPLEQL